MNAPQRAAARPAVRDAHTWRGEASKVATPMRGVLLCGASLAAMAPWPALGIVVSREQFDTPAEAFALFGGVTLLPLMLLMLVKVPVGVVYAIIVLVWAGAAIAPAVWLRRRLTTWWAIVGLVAAQSAFSLVQAAAAAMLILGKGV
ncbi:MAG: hypothetical protein SFY95_11305 [Planctomycetota bacterium]|nr:hypothetical protein [Planctomycetota bacterium]